MEYAELLINISKDKRFQILQSRYDESHFGDFQISLTYCNRVCIEIVNDRGVIDVYIIYKKVIEGTQIPMGYAINLLEEQNVDKNFDFSSVSDAQEFLLNNANRLDAIANPKILRDIALQWAKRKEGLHHHS